jgi:hypothetical protein
MPIISVKKQLVMACHITGIYDVNRNTTLQNDDYSLVKDWADSVAALKLQGIIFHNNFTENTCEKYENEYISFVKIGYNAEFNPNVYRYFIYRDFLRQHFNEIESVFVSDISDVVVLINPFIEPLFIQNSHCIFCGDEPKLLNNDWMKDHAKHLRSGISDYAQYEKDFKNAVLLNCGIIGGNFPVMLDFIEKLCAIHEQYNKNNTTAYTGDMGAFNYLVRTQFNDCVLHGAPINTEFKAYEIDRTDCWLRHK